MAALGLVIGLFGAWAAGRFLSSLLYEVTPADPLTFAAVAVLLSLITVLAGLKPARRAARTIRP